MPFKSPAIQNKDATSAGNDNIKNASYAVSNTESKYSINKCLICINF